MELPIWGTDLEDIPNYEEYCYFVSIGDVGYRKLWFDRIRNRRLSIINIIDSSAIISSGVKMGIGNFVGKMAVINADAEIGNNNVINTKALIEHECKVGDHNHLSTNSVINGNVIVGNSVFLGSSSVCNGQLKIGSNAIIGSGSVIIKDVGECNRSRCTCQSYKEERLEMSDIQIVAEIGCNHNGSVELAKKMMKEAKEAGADAVKFQSFVPENIVSRYAPKAEYQKKNDGNGSQLDMLKKLALTEMEYLELVQYAATLDIQIFSTPFDFESFSFLQKISQDIWKVPSGEITNLPYLQKVAAIECQNKQVILSTGMSTIDEVKYAVNVLQQSKDTSFTVLHCNTQYPTDPEDMNLRAMNKLQELAPDWKIGLSDHSEGIVASLVAVGLGAKFIEKHFTLDKAMPGPDHKASITPEELKELCVGVHKAEIMLGNETKEVTESERSNIFVARKSIVAKRKIMRGEMFSEENITCKRPGNGISPIHWYEVLGKEAEKDFEIDELISCKGVNREDE